MNLDQIKPFAFFPDTEEVRSDIADYYFEVQRFDSDVAKAIAALEKSGELDNTIIVITGDHGMPFPRCKSNLYDSGTKVPLAIRWGKKIKSGQTYQNFASLIDLAPTFLTAAGIEVPKAMTVHNLLPVLTAGDDEKLRPFIIAGKERHVPSQEAPDLGGYPSRMYRDHSYLYIRNYSANRWPNGTPHLQKAMIKNTWYGDTDNGPTKSFIIDNKNRFPESYELCFAKRPTEELYDLRKDPEQMINLASTTPEVTKKYADLLTAELKNSADPRHGGEAFDFDVQKYGGGGPTYPKKK